MAEEIYYKAWTVNKGKFTNTKKNGKYREFKYENSWMSSCRAEIMEKDGVKKNTRIMQFQMKDLPPM